ncbi:beta-ketoacyl synthase chain length factor [Fulvivirga sp. 29W222]|uniref:Beta-ketoacyl synthase chain length factor n=1 Tax=Fulvivirga marina TaxID=2494733 RepID=A0A937KBT2_9BACT|nr:beta-ketoacyl synthase chain length factor [Fulvivirga marina]MBL6446524.1 beta-ketoacyl synthase chain length factor [Fulvivirga marina]
MKVYITASSAITPQNTFDSEKYLDVWQSSDLPYQLAIEPDYKSVIDPKLARRMSRIIKMSVATGNKVLAEADIGQPDAIVVGTGLGCIKDTEKFLREIINEEEGLLSPTAFIQSTHNTIAGQLALMLQCSEDNFTYVNRGHSFENALADAMMRIYEGADHVLLGGTDEMTSEVHNILTHMNCGGNTLLGEGACFFMISNTKIDGAVCIEGLDTVNYITTQQITERVKSFLRRNNVDTNEVDALILGIGEGLGDPYYKEIIQMFTPDIPVINFKEVTGEYFTASAYAFNVGSEMLRKQCIFPKILISGNNTSGLTKVLIYNHYQGVNHTISLLSL